MRILLHDYSGHPFQAQLSRELSRRGHEVVHSSCPAYSSGKGRLEAAPGERVVFEPVGEGRVIEKMRFRRRLFVEVRLGLDLVQQVRRVRPDVVMVANVPMPMLVVVAACLRLLRRPWVLWHQDVQSVAVASFAGTKLSRTFSVVARAFDVAERWCSQRAAAIVVIAESFLDVHRRWGTAAKTTLVPNWAPLDEIVPLPRDNDWSAEHGLTGVQTLLYSGTLGLKHDPALLVRLARRVIDSGRPVQLVVVNEGPAETVLREEAGRLGVPLTLLPFQPYDRLSEVLATGDVLVVLLEQDAGAFSVPSKTLSYLCAGRPVLGLMPAENLASRLVTDAEGCVLPPSDRALDEAAAWVRQLLGDPEQAMLAGKKSRQLAEEEFALDGCAATFERVLAGAAVSHRGVASRLLGSRVVARPAAP
jgi:glycosyltransferase involved in cell wall biosynthesis